MASFARKPSNGGVALNIASEDDSEKLSADLALFLSNPDLKAALADGSLDLTSYSSTINAELSTLER